MNEDFQDIFSKFSEILKEKNIDLNNVAEESNTSATNDISIDINTIIKIKEIISKINQNNNLPRNNLLNSIKPYLKEEKQEKLDNYIKIANLLTIMDDCDLGIDFLKQNKKGYDYILIITLILLII